MYFPSFSSVVESRYLFATEAQLELFDTHCHLQDERYQGDLEPILRRAREAGVTRMVCCGTREEDWPRVLELAKRQEGWLERLGELARKHPLGIGECGLDFALPEADRAGQERAFRAQLRLARDLDRPLSIHCRQAWESLLRIAREEDIPGRGAVVHAFSGSPELAIQLQDLGFPLGFGCSLARPGNKRGPKALLAVRSDRLLLETDAPDLPPRHLPDWPPEALNEPRYLPLVLESVSGIRGEPPGTLAPILFGNAMRIFGGRS